MCLLIGLQPWILHLGVLVFGTIFQFDNATNLIIVLDPGSPSAYITSIANLISASPDLVKVETPQIFIDTHPGSVVAEFPYGIMVTSPT